MPKLNDYPDHYKIWLGKQLSSLIGVTEYEGAMILHEANPEVVDSMHDMVYLTKESLAEALKQAR